MSNEKLPPTVPTSETLQPSATDELIPQPSRKIRRRSFLKGLGVTGAAATLGAGIMAKSVPLFAEEGSGSLTEGDAAILRFLAAAEIIESDIWLQYQELGGTQDNEVSTMGSKLIPGYPAQPTGGYGSLPSPTPARSSCAAPPARLSWVEPPWWQACHPTSARSWCAS